MIRLTYNIGIKCVDEDKAYYRRLLALCQSAYNRISELIFVKQLPLSGYTVFNTVYHQLRKDMPDLPADSLNQVIRMVVGNYKSSRSRRIKLSSPLRMTHPFIQLTRATCSAMTANAVKMLSATKGKKVWNTLLVYPKFAELAAKYPMAHPRMFERNDNIYLSIPFEVAGKQESDETCLGIDLGLRRLATTSDGMAYTDKAYLSRRRKLRYLKRCLQHKKKQTIN